MTPPTPNKGPLRPVQGPHDPTRDHTTISIEEVRSGDLVIFKGGVNEPPFFKDCTDPRGKLVAGQVYTVTEVHVFRYHTILKFKEIAGWYNSVDFKSPNPDKNHGY